VVVQVVAPADTVTVAQDLVVLVLLDKAMQVAKVADSITVAAVVVQVVLVFLPLFSAMVDLENTVTFLALVTTGAVVEVVRDTVSMAVTVA
jgi:hypothetical protein